MRYALLLGIIFLSFSATAELDEFTISNKDKTCSIHYLTSKTKYNWKIKVPSNSCKNGWVDGYTEVQIYSPTNELTETLSGFFSEGYWLDSFPAVNHIVERNSPKNKIQTLSFLLGKDEEAEITYIGQLRAHQLEGRAYTAFQGCPDFRVLVVTPDTSIFENQAFQDKIVEQGLKYAYSHCAKPEILALFGANSIKDPQITFQMQVDCRTKKREIIPIQKDLESTDSNHPLELREEAADILMQVKPEEEKMVVSYHPSKEVLKPMLEKTPSPIFPVAHLKILSDVFEKPQRGRAIVHIKKILLNGNGITDLPEEISLLYFPNLKEGWAIVDGELYKDEMKVFDIQFCQKEWCSDVL